MKLRNKKTGEIVIFGEGIVDLNQIGCKNVAEMMEAGWEDYEESKDTNYWYIDSLGKIEFHSTILDEIAGTPNNAMIRKIIGNYFETKEEAEQAVEKLKAWKRLKDYYIKFRLDFVKNTINFTYRIDGTLHSVVNEERIIFEDMKTIFGGEDDKK